MAETIVRNPLFYQNEKKKNFLRIEFSFRKPLRLNKRFQCHPKVSKYQPTIAWINDSSQNTFSVFIFVCLFLRTPCNQLNSHNPPIGNSHHGEVLSHYLIVKARTRKNLGENVIWCPRSLVCVFFFVLVSSCCCIAGHNLAQYKK